jgi:TonB family protein
VEPIYSEAARKLFVSGVVTVQVVISPDGTTRDFRIIKSPGYGLDEKAIDAVRLWRFIPGMRDGKAVAVLATVQVNFGLLAPKTRWRAGPMVFAAEQGVIAPVVEDGDLPKPGRDASDESVVLEFTVAPNGAVGNIHEIHGSGAAVKLLSDSLANWKFRPAMKGNEPVEDSGRVTFVKGQP